MKIAICEDEQRETEYMQQLLIKYNNMTEPDVFSSSVALLESSIDTFYDIILMDIEMPELSGFTAAEQLMSRKDKPLIIFTTKSSAYSVRGYDVAFHYLVKPISYEKLKAVLDRAIAQVMPQRILLPLKNGETYIKASDILYCESLNYEIAVVCRDESYIIRRSLKLMEALLAGANFARPHNSYLVNLLYVKRIASDNIELEGGQKIPLSRACKKSFLYMLHQHIGG